MPATGWTLDDDERRRLLACFPPRWPDVVADHITLDSRARRDDPPPRATRAEIVGSVDDGGGVQALVVAIDGSTDRPGGGTYHITWSLDRDRGRKGAETNDVIARLRWHPLAEPVPIRIVPARREQGFGN